MKKAVISSGGKQYLVSEGETLEVEVLHQPKDEVSFEPLMIVDTDKVSIGTPVLEKNKVEATVIDPDKQAEKVTSIRFKAKKRVHTVRGHRQRHSVIKITKIS